MTGCFSPFIDPTRSSYIIVVSHSPPCPTFSSSALQNLKKKKNWFHLLHIWEPKLEQSCVNNCTCFSQLIFPSNRSITCSVVQVSGDPILFIFCILPKPLSFDGGFRSGHYSETNSTLCAFILCLLKEVHQLLVLLLLNLHSSPTANQQDSQVSQYPHLQITCDATGTCICTALK